MARAGWLLLLARDKQMRAKFFLLGVWSQGRQRRWMSVSASATYAKRLLLVLNAFLRCWRCCIYYLQQGSKKRRLSQVLESDATALASAISAHRVISSVKEKSSQRLWRQWLKRGDAVGGAGRYFWVMMRDIAAASGPSPDRCQFDAYARRRCRQNADCWRARVSASELFGKTH
ncbi:hypothetical protein KCP78_03735 [Salmonella enterica subsp. enterica]|nr:hypothetical protein KCP78_03735 [Salmonella enterica subsp. enterica]